MQTQMVMEMARQKEEMSGGMGGIYDDYDAKDNVIEHAMTSTGTKIVGKVHEVKLERPDSKVESKKKKVV